MRRTIRVRCTDNEHRSENVDIPVCLIQFVECLSPCSSIVSLADRSYLTDESKEEIDRKIAEASKSD